MVSLFSPIKIGNLEIKNRIVMPPMAMDKATPEGEVTKWIINHYRKRAKGIGLVIVEHSYVHPLGKLAPTQLGIWDDKLIPGLKRLAKAIQKQGTPVALQINHAGSRTSAQVLGTPPLAPSALPHPLGGKIPQELNLQEIESLVENFAQAARRAKEAGFNAVEVHGAHGFLLNQFHSPLTNQRKDQYGGSLENRIRFTLEVIAAVKREVGEDFPLFFRLGADDRMAGGLNLEEAKIIAERLVEAGVHLIDVSGGLCGSRPKDLENTPGYFVPLAEEIKKVVEVPVIGVGGIKTPQVADQIIKEGRVDLVAVGRAILKDPHWALKTQKSSEEWEVNSE